MLKRAVALVLAASLTGCASAPKSKFGPISTATLAALQSDAVRVDVLPGKQLSHMTAVEQAMMSGGVFFGAIGAVIASGAAIASANRRGAVLTRSDGLVDPSQTTAAKLRTRLEAQGHAVSADANLSLRIATTNWALARENVAYFATLQVLDAKAGKVLTKGECKYFRDGSQLGVTSDQLLADSSAKLKTEFEQAAEYCAAYFADTLYPTKA